jgi:hypothetical protein
MMPLAPDGIGSRTPAEAYFNECEEAGKKKLEQKKIERQRKKKRGQGLPLSV